MRDGKMELELMNFDLCMTLESAVEIMAPDAHQKGLLIQSATGFNIPKLLRGDEGRIRQILINLISNAIKFTEGGSISVGAYWRGADSGAGPASETQGEIILSVIDTGPGIAPEEENRIFHPFTQIEDPENRSITGTGLGLTIVKDLVALMGGEIKLQSTPGDGAQFWIRLPMLAVGEPEKQPDLTGKKSVWFWIQVLTLRH